MPPKFLLVAMLIFSMPLFASASNTNGVIDSTSKYAWGENIGWINFGASDSNVQITDSAIIGYAWSANYGWINLNPLTGGILNDGAGNLSGYAWGENLGWIDFADVSINSSGEFMGYAVIENDSSRVSLNCANTSCTSSDFKVKTDWRPQSVRPACNNALDDDSDGKIDYPADPGCGSLTDEDETDAAAGGSVVIIQTLLKNIVSEIAPQEIEILPQAVEPISSEPKVSRETDYEPTSQPSSPSSGGISVIEKSSQTSLPSNGGQIIGEPNFVKPENISELTASSSPTSSKLTPSKPPPLNQPAKKYEAKSFKTKAIDAVSKVADVINVEFELVKSFSMKVISFINIFIKSLFFWR